VRTSFPFCDSAEKQAASKPLSEVTPGIRGRPNDPALGIHGKVCNLDQTVRNSEWENLRTPKRAEGFVFTVLVDRKSTFVDLEPAGSFHCGFQDAEA
jgi:hypothetical protein